MPTVVREFHVGDRVRIGSTVNRYNGVEGVLISETSGFGGADLWNIDPGDGSILRFYAENLTRVEAPTPREFQIGDWVRVARARHAGGGAAIGVEFQITNLHHGADYSYAEGVRRNGEYLTSVYLYRLDLVDAAPSTEEPATAPPSVDRTPLTKTREDVQAKLAEYRSAPTSGHARLAIELLEWVMA